MLRLCTPLSNKSKIPKYLRGIKTSGLIFFYLPPTSQMLGEMERNSSLFLPFPSFTLCEGSCSSLHKVPGVRLQSSRVSGLQPSPGDQRPPRRARLSQHGSAGTKQLCPVSPGRAAGVLATPQHLDRLRHHKAFNTVQFQRQPEQLRKAPGKATDTPDPRLRATQLEELLEPRTLPDAGTLGRGLLSSQSQGNLGESGERPVLSIKSVLRLLRPSPLYTHIYLLKLHRRAATLS